MPTDPLNIKKWQIGSTEIAKYCPIKGPSGASSFQLYIPTLMPLIGGPSIPKQVVGALSDSCYLNDIPCKPSIAKTIRTQNYKTVPIIDHNPFRHPIFYQGAQMSLDIANGDVQTMFVTNRIDHSVER